MKNLEFRIRHWFAALLLLSAFQLFSVSVFAQDLYVNLVDAGLGLSTATNRDVIVTGNSVPRGVSSGVVMQDRFRKTTDVTGGFWLSNLVVGVYHFDVLKVPFASVPMERSEFRVLFTNTTGVAYARENMVASPNNTYPPDSVAWGAAASDWRFVKRAEITNLVTAIGGSGNPNALSNNYVGDVRLLGSLAVNTQYVSHVESTNLSTLSFTAGGVELVIESGAVKVRSPYYYQGRGDALTDIPLAGVTGLTPALTWLTNNAGSMSAAEFQARALTNQFAGSNIVGTVNARFATNAPDGNPIASTNNPFFGGPLRVQPPSGLYGAGGNTIGINTNFGPAIDAYNGFMRVIMDASGLNFLNQNAGQTFLSVVPTGQKAGIQSSNIVATGLYYGVGSLLRGVLGKDTYALKSAMPVPQLGFNLWWFAGSTNGGVGTNITQALVLGVATNAVDYGLVASGWNGMYLDAGLVNKARNGSGDFVETTQLFPDGLKALTTNLKQNGFRRVGAYTSYGSGDCNAVTAGTTTFGNEQRDMAWFANRGFNAIKIDACVPVASPDGIEGPYWAEMVAGLFSQANDELFGGMQYTSGFEGGTNMEVMQLLMSYNQARHDELADRTRGTASPKILGSVNVLEESNLFAMTDNFADHLTNAFPRLREQWLVRPGHYVEFSEACLPVFYGTNTFKGNLSLHAMLSSPIYCSWRSNMLTAGYITFMTNASWIGIHQNPGVFPCTSLSSNADWHIWRKPLGFGSTTNGYAVALINSHQSNTKGFTLYATNLGVLPGQRFRVTDVWAQRELLTTETDTFSSLSYTVGTNTLEILRVDILDVPPQATRLFEKDEFLQFGNSGIFGDLNWYGAANGGVLASFAPSGNYMITNYPRQGILQIGNTSTTLNQGSYAMMRYSTSGDYQPYARPDLWTNWSSKFVVRFVNTNNTSVWLGFVGGASGWYDQNPPSAGMNIRWDSAANSSANKPCLIIHGAATTTNYFSSDVTAHLFHTFRIFNSTGITNIVQAQMDGGPIISITNALNNTSLGRNVKLYSLGGKAPLIWLDYFEFELVGVKR